MLVKIENDKILIGIKLDKKSIQGFEKNYLTHQYHENTKENYPRLFAVGKFSTI